MSPEIADARRLLAGSRQIVRAARQGRLEKVFLASDAEERMLAEIRRVCIECALPIEEGRTMRELGETCRIAVGTAAAGLLKPT